MSNPQQAPVSRPLSRREAAAYLGISTATLAKWASAGGGKGPRYSRSANQRGHVWYRVEDLEKFVEQRAVSN